MKSFLPKVRISLALCFLLPTGVIPAKAESSSTNKQESKAVQRYTYVFQGQALSDGRPCAHAQVRIQVTSMHSEAVKQVETDILGGYRISMEFSGKVTEPINWTLDAFTQDFKRATLEGASILLGESTVTLEKSLDFQAS